MLTTKKISFAISALCVGLQYFFIFYSAVIIANGIWWLLSPSRSNIYVEWIDPDRADKSANYIINRYPFGIVVVPKVVEAAKPRIVDQLKLKGIYLNTPSDSIALVDYESKPIILKTGQFIGSSDAILKLINNDSIVVTENGVDATIKMSYISEPANTGYNPSRNLPNTLNAPAQDTIGNDLRDRRRKLMEDFNRDRQQISQTGGVIQHNTQNDNDAPNNNIASNNDDANTNNSHTTNNNGENSQ